MRAEDQATILTAVEDRVSTATVHRATAKGVLVEEVLSESLYHERKRLKDERRSKARDADIAFWDGVQAGLRRATDGEREALLRRVVRHYAGEIAGNFDDRVYQFATRLLPPALGLLLNAASPMRIARRLPELPKIEEAVVLQGEIEQLKRLHEKGTVILVPTHVSNLDSIIIGFALYQLGLPPFIYGAGLNLFSNPLLGFFMHNLGAYTVDRKKTDPLYKEVLKEYATLTLEYGYDNIFFPGGTRSRSGAIERKVKMGLLGTGISAYVDNLKRSAPNPKIYVVPATLSYQLVLEAETLIDDFLKDVGKSRYIIEDDESTKPRTVFEFMSQLLGLESKIHVTISRALDPFGNPVDDEGESLDPCGRRIDVHRYVLANGAPKIVADRDAEYTREVGERIMDAYTRDNVVSSTHVTARVIHVLLRRASQRTDLLRFLRSSAVEEDLGLLAVYEETERLLGELRGLARDGKIRLGEQIAAASAEDVVADGLAHFAIFHSRPAAERRGDRVVAVDRNLILYYQNRLEGYDLDQSAGIRPTLSKDHRAIATS
ncbi:1-acyl-sn-glycerol-3-phosphate acyltransferase [Myxococcota bacterium]|nr:1-acyl-sn-glycerol-3-phosphate acyltransferase [Myxococcota bacterium]